jgi:CRISPR-associated protein Csm4
MKTLVIEPQSPFSEIPRSDTLFGAICWGIRLSRGEDALEDILARFAKRDPPFLVSSAFPRLDRDDSEAVSLLAKPMLPDMRAGTDSASEARIEALGAWKRVEYVPAALFRALVTGELSSDDLLGGLEGGTLVLDGRAYERRGRFVLPAADADTDESGSPREPYQRAEQTRNAINRLTGSTDGNLYHRERVFFAANAGLHILVEGEVDLVAESLALLQDRGIGGGRSIGNGQFRLGGIEEIEGIESPAAGTERCCTLSLCVPRPEEIASFFDEGFYKVVTRQGVVENSLASPEGIWKRRVLALAEGSVLPWRGGPQGHNPIVADHFEHGVQQFGYALPVSVKRELP